MRIQSILLQIALLSCPFIAATQHFVMTAVPNGNSIQVYLKPVGGNITTGFTDIEFFFRNPMTSADPGFSSVTVNSTDFPNVLIPYNGMNVQGTEVGYNNYWFGISFALTPSRTYNQNQEYLLCSVNMPASPIGLGLELCHNEPFFSPHYIALTDGGGNDLTNQSGNKFYGTGATACSCPATTPGENHLLPLGAPLPVELINFFAKKLDDKSAKLSWLTGAQDGLSSFIVQRSSGHGGWEDLGQVSAKAEYSNYQFFDDGPPIGEVYYRLLLLDHDGYYEYSPTRSLTFLAGLTAKFYPNPASRWVVLELGEGIGQAEPVRIQLFNMNGILVLDRQIPLGTGASHKLPLADGDIPNGEYLLVARIGGKSVLSERLVIAR